MLLNNPAWEVSSSDFLPGASPTQEAMIHKTWIALFTTYNLCNMHWHYMQFVSLKAELVQFVPRISSCMQGLQVASCKALQWMNKKHFAPVTLLRNIKLCFLGGQMITAQKPKLQNRDNLIGKKTIPQWMRHYYQIVTYSKCQIFSNTFFFQQANWTISPYRQRWLLSSRESC